ncbi:MAG TPA: tetratricopeptide repeat protein [Verrucomicrobiae bacterium]|nr:tetratricopeptide repeat protein [Verrucomicrobiae bacterium]
MFRFWRGFARERTPRELALAALERGSYAEAEARFGRLLEDAVSNPERAFLLNKRGVARVGLELRAAARDDFLAAVSAHGRHAPALANLGNLLLEAGDLAGAIARYEAAVAADEECAIAHFNLGIAYKRAGRLEEGVRALRRAQRLEGRRLGKPTTRP